MIRRITDELGLASTGLYMYIDNNAVTCILNNATAGSEF